MDSSPPHHKSPHKETRPQAWDRAALLNRVQSCRRYLGHLPLVTTLPLSRECRKVSDTQRDEEALVDTLRNYGVMASSSILSKSQYLSFCSLQSSCSCFYILGSRISSLQLTEWDISSRLDPSMQTLQTFPCCPLSVTATNLLD